jgi:hypothetical protein
LIYWDQVMDALPNASAVVLQHDPLHVTEPA